MIESDETFFQDESELDDDGDDDDEIDDSIYEESYDSLYGIMRDKHGRFAPVMSMEELEEYNVHHADDILIEKKMRKFLKEYDRKIQLKPNEKHLLFLLVNKFKDVEEDLDTGELNYKLSQFKRKPYHEVLIKHRLAKFTESKVEPGRRILTPTSRVMFNRFVNSMISQGLIKKKKHGRHLYLRITQEGLDKLLVFHLEHPGEVLYLGI